MLKKIPISSNHDYVLCSYLAPLLDNESLENTKAVQEASSSFIVLVSVMSRISEVLVNAFWFVETGAVGPSDWTSGEWAELLQLRNSYSRLILMDD